MTTHAAAGGNGSTRTTIRATLERVLPPATMLTVGVGAVLAPTAEAATFTVTNLNDAGAGSLRQALTDANNAPGADIVAFQAGLTGTITLTTGQLDITDAVEVQGPGAASITVSGNNASRVFYLYTDGNFAATISGLTVTGGAASSGAGIVNFAQDLTLVDMVVQGNAATNAGGGVLTVNGGTLVLDNCTVSGNTAINRAGGVGLYNGFISVADSVISGNAAQGNGGGLYLYAVDGNVTIATTTISGNTSIGVPRSDAPFGMGGFTVPGFSP
jgi:parallel beta-helix repeat protein